MDYRKPAIKKEKIKIEFSFSTLVAKILIAIGFAVIEFGPVVAMLTLRGFEIPFLCMIICYQVARTVPFVNYYIDVYVSDGANKPKPYGPAPLLFILTVAVFAALALGVFLAIDIPERIVEFVKNKIIPASKGSIVKVSKKEQFEHSVFTEEKK